MKRFVFVTAIISGFTTSILAEERRGKPPPVELTVGQLGYQSGFAQQNLGFRNHYGIALANVFVECTFFSKGELIATVRNVVRNIAPGTSGFVTLVHPTDVAPDHAQCEIVEIKK
jgi:hypothetical protein